MRKLIVLIAGLAATAVLAAPAKVDDYAMRASLVAPGVYAVITPARDFPSAENKGWNSNSVFAVTEDGVLVIDSGSSETIGQALRKLIAETTKQPVRWIINTHGHGDHWLGNAALADAKTEIIASSAVRDRIAKEGADWVERFKSMTGGLTGDSKIARPTRTIDVRTTLTLGGLQVELLPSGDGHSPGDLAVWLPQQRVLVGGDVLYVGRAPATFDSKIQPWIAFLKELEMLKPLKIVPGHGPVADGAAIGLQRGYLEDLWKVVEAGYQQGQPDFEILPRAREVMARHKKRFPDLDTRLGESVSHTYLQVEAASF